MMVLAGSGRKTAALPVRLPLVLAVLLTAAAPAATAASEYELKAAFLLNFVQFVQWPPERVPSAKVPVVLGILGRDPFGPAVASAVNGRTIRGRPVSMRRVASVQEARQCHMLFISSSERDQLKDILRSLAGTSVLTVSDIERFTEAGGAIGLIPDQSRIHFEVNLDAAAAAGLKINSDLLALAKTVRKGSGRE